MALKPETQGSVLQKVKDAINEWRGLPSDAMREALENKIDDIAQRADVLGHKWPGSDRPAQSYSNIDDMLDIKTTSHVLDSRHDKAREWLERAKTATTRDDVQKVLEEQPLHYQPPAGDITKIQNEWLEDWTKHHPPVDPPTGGGSTSTDSSENYVDEILGGRNPPRPAPKPDQPQLPQEPVKVGGDGGGEVEIDFGKLKGGRGQSPPPPPPQVEPPQPEPPQIEPPQVQPPNVQPPGVKTPKVDRSDPDGEIGSDDITPPDGIDIPNDLRNPPPSDRLPPPPGPPDPPGPPEPPPGPPEPPPGPPEPPPGPPEPPPGPPEPPPGPPEPPPPGPPEPPGPPWGPPEPPPLPPDSPPDPPWGPPEPPPLPPGPPSAPGVPPIPPPAGPSFPSIPLAPLAPVIAAGGKEVVKAAGKEIVTKVIGVVVIIAVAIGGTKLVVDQLSGGSTNSGSAGVTSPAAPTGTATIPVTATATAASSTPAAPGKFSGNYNVSERDRSGNCPEGTPFRKALAAGQTGPNYNYNLRVTTGGGRVSFAPTSGGTAIFSAALAADDTFEGDSGGEYPVTGKFKGSSGPGTSFDLQWTVRYGAGSCTTDLFGQFTSG
jgi:hypothetical protein